LIDFLVVITRGAHQQNSIGQSSVHRSSLTIIKVGDLVRTDGMLT
jgi:hypothetical protein